MLKRYGKKNGAILAFFCHHNNRSAGVSIMFKKGLDFTIHDTKFDQNGRYIVIDITLFEQRLTLVCLYGYNTDEPLLFDDILYKIAFYANTSILLCGDWNVVQDCNLDTYNILHKRNPKSREKIEEIIEKLELLDPWRTCHPTDRKFTWRQPSPIKQSRLDYFLVTEDIYSLMKNTKIIPGYKTDHSAIVFTFSASLAKRGKGYWKFNSQLVRDVEYVEKIKTCIKDTISEYYLSGDIQNCLDVKLTCNDQLFFEILKMKIRTLSISYSIEKNREDREHTSKLEKEVEQLENIMNMSPNVNVQATLYGKKLELENKREQKIEGIDFSLDLQAMLDINFTKKIKEMSSILKAWEHRKLTLLGKITVVKTLALPKIIHLLTLLTALPNLSQIKIKEFNTLFYNFIWNGELERIKRNTLIGDFMQGGLNMVHLSSFSTYLKISWVRRLLLNLEGSWQTLYYCLN
ncbi:Hypothetical predicted protein [Mytilus galloprovincialis]|uniref:Endonuclease/exonuclease/phosphatase domain-containing protein n=1 Tax=Mytilus galloprovincialis TaxID=29158 RepID=A0A8B6DF07_MYTGA|nr:Hypothetical predicted protein [Mytilus galloprovincialis]